MQKKLTILCLLAAMATGATAQVKLSVDTLECHIIGFTFGALMPGGGSASSGMTGGNTADLYKGPFLDFSLGCDYKYKSNWMVTLDGDLWFGYNSDNLEDRAQRMGDIYTPGGYLLSWGGYDGEVQAYNRSLAVRVGVAKILPVIKNNPNSGIMFKLSGGWMMQKTVFNQDYTQSPVPQLNGNYAKLYDHLRNGALLTESVGFIFMSNMSTYVNFKVSFDVSQCISWSSRSYQIDNVMGLNGKDSNRYFDLMYGVRLTWMFPLMGKTTYDYYYY
ncbi:MAG: hypothetical protein IKC19_02010 [Bacteroidales bacterium]|nr:hypothetical protein [Bacteroidales bacterium]